MWRSGKTPLRCSGRGSKNPAPLGAGSSNHFGTPIYEIRIKYLDDNTPVIKEANLLVESPCGASNISLDYLRGKEISPETLNAFSVNLRHECREPVSILLTHEDISESSASLHLLKLLDAIEKADPSLFIPGTVLGDYVA